MNLARSLGSLVLTAAAISHLADPYADGIRKWRQEQEDHLKVERGWLSVAGLFWLSDGANSVGSDPSSKVRLPAGSPANLGTIQFQGGTARFTATEGADVRVNGLPASPNQVLKSDAQGAPDKLTIGSITLTVIQRGARTGIRMYDQNAKTLREFTGRKWYDVDPKFHVRATYTPYLPPKDMPITNILGDTSIEKCVGYVTFVLGGKKLTLQALDEGDVLFFNIRDKTSGETTYTAGRFLYTSKPKNGYVDLDFNRAENPPCAFTTFATCPLPPKENILPIAVTAGEKKYGSH